MRRFRLSPDPAPGKPAHGDRLEIAWDGHRVLACRVDDDVRLFSGDGREWTKTFPSIVTALRKLETRTFVLDGFVCALVDARPSFDALRTYVKKPKPGAHIVFAVWDVLDEGDTDLRAVPLRDRLARLHAILARAKDPIVASQPLEGSPITVLETLETMGVRGLVARAEDAAYDAPATCVSATDEPIAWDRSLSAPPAVTNADKVLYPRDAITKTDIARYYDEVAPAILRVMRDRPVVCQRWPDGIDDFTWYQHRMPPRAPDYLRAVWIEGNRRVVIETRDGLLWMVNQAALTFHGWASRCASLKAPDWVILDLDPGESTKWDTVIDVALAIRKLLEMLELPSIPKTSGQKGLHVLVPIAPGHTPEQAHALAYGISAMVSRLYPNEVSLEAQTEARRGRLYLDHLQNFMGKSLVLPYSLRAADGAPVSTPLTWAEVTRKLDPRAFTLKTTRARLDAKGDLAEPLTTGTAKIAPAIVRLKP